MLRVGPMCRYVEDIPRLIEVMGGEKVPELRLSDPVDFNKARFYYMEGIQIPTIQSLSCEMKSALLKVQTSNLKYKLVTDGLAVSHFESKFNVEAIRVDLPLVAKAVEILLSSLDTEGEPRIGDYLVSLEGNKGRLNWKVEIPKFFMGKSVHTPGALFTCMFDDLDRMSAEDKAEFLRLRDRLIRQVTELLGNDGILLFPSWPQTAPFHHQTVLTPFNLAYTGLFNALALPVIQCPTGLDSNGLPLGVQVVGSPNADRLLVCTVRHSLNLINLLKTHCHLLSVSHSNELFVMITAVYLCHSR
ncbi:hypothetical protein COOONC_21121 [Cooperia oncophora]